MKLVVGVLSLVVAVGCSSTTPSPAPECPQPLTAVEVCAEVIGRTANDPASCNCDVNADGSVGADDLTILAADQSIWPGCDGL